MASQIDATIPADNVKVDKAEVREQFSIAKDEITALQNVTATPRRLAYDDAQFDTA